MSEAYQYPNERRNRVNCSICGKPAAPAGCISAVCGNCVQENLMGQKAMVHVDPETGSTIIEPGYLPGQTERIVQDPPPNYRRHRKTEAGEAPARVPRTIGDTTEVPKRIPRRKPRNVELEKAFDEKAGLVQKELEELGEGETE